MFEDLHNKGKAFDFSDIEQKILFRTSQFEIPNTISKADAYDKLKSKMSINSQHDLVASKAKRSIYWISSAAALLLILVGIWTVLMFGSVDIVAPKGQQLNYVLPDGSQVTINAESEISFNKKGFLKNRFIKLDGEAFFKVKKGSSFVIRTQFADIRVLGTSFNIYSRDGLFKVSCISGKVQVKNENDTVILTPGESATVTNNNLLEYRDKNIEATVNWRVGEFYFEKTALNVVFKEIERQFNVTFVLPDIDNKLYTGGFSNKNLVDALDVVCIPMNLNYEIGTNSKILISNKTE